MTGELDETFGGLSVDLIEQFGKSILYTRTTAGDYDPTTSSARVVHRPCFVDVIVEEVNGRTFSNNLILADDKQITLAAQGFKEPELLDFFEIDRVKFTIAENGIKKIYSGSLVALYIIQGHKS